MGVDLGVVLRHRGVDAERFHAPLQISIPVAAAQRQTFAQRRFVNLDDANARRFQIRHFITQCQGDLFGDGFTGHVFTRERPAENGHRAGQHPFHRLIRQGLGVLRPFNGDRFWTADVTDDHRRLHAAGAVALHPAVLSKDEAVQVFTEVFYHVVTLGLAVHQHVQPQAFLLDNRLLDVFRDAGAVVIRIQIALFEVQAQAADLRRLREGADRRGRPCGKVEAGALGFGAHFIRALALAVLGGDGRQTFFYRRVVHASRVTTRLNRGAPVGNRRRVAAVQGVAQQRQLFTFLQGEGKPAFHFRVEAGLHAEIDRTVQQGAGRGHPQFTFADDVLDLCVFLGQIGTPDVTTIDQTSRKEPVCRQALVQQRHIVLTVNQVNVQALNRQRDNGLQVRRHAFKIGGQQ